MVSDKNIHFRDIFAEKSSSPKRFQEPEGMTNIDLENIITKNDDVPGRKCRKIINTTILKKKMIQLIVIIAFVLFGTITFLMVIPPNDGVSLSQIWERFFRNESHGNLLEKCKTSRSIEDCCTIYSKFAGKTVIEDCTVEGVIDTFLQQEEQIFSSLVNESANSSSNSGSNFIEIGIPLIESSDYNYGDSDYYDYDLMRKISSSGDIDLIPKVMSNVTIETMTNPIIDGKNVNFEIKNTHIKLSDIVPESIFFRKKRQNPQYAGGYYGENERYFEPFENNKLYSPYFNDFTNDELQRPFGAMQPRFWHGNQLESQSKVHEHIYKQNYFHNTNQKFELIPHPHPQLSSRVNDINIVHLDGMNQAAKNQQETVGVNFEVNKFITKNNKLDNLNTKFTNVNDRKDFVTSTSYHSTNKNIKLPSLPLSEHIHSVTNPSISQTFRNLIQEEPAFNPLTSTNLPVLSLTKQLFDQNKNIKKTNSQMNQKSIEDLSSIDLNQKLTAVISKNNSFRENIESYEDETTEALNTSTKGNAFMDEFDIKRVNAGQKQFRANNKMTQFTSAAEDLKTSHYSAVNPFFNQQNPCIPTYMPPINSPYPVIQQQVPYSYSANPRFAQLVPFARNSPVNSYVINPHFTYLSPNYQQLVPNVNPQVPAVYYNTQNFPSTDPLQVEGPGGQYYVCNPIPTPSNQSPLMMSGVEVRQNSDPLNLQELLAHTIETDYVNNKTRASPRCRYKERRCADDKNCIKLHQICDAEVNCNDASDEVSCSCKKRVGPARLCDGYFDCPNGEDELGCFGCDEDAFNCDDWSQDRAATCILLEQRCDGIAQCPTGRDEEDCSVLTNKVGQHLRQYKVSNTMGFLHRNYKGRWYPACSNPEIWAVEACEIEAGPSSLPPLTHMIPIKPAYHGKYINALPDDGLEIVTTCVPGRAVYVECPRPICGTRRLEKNYFRAEEVDTSVEEVLSKFMGDRTKLNASEILGKSRVVGGKPSQPAAWPWVVSIYRNGAFHCGGALISEQWIVTAAHCVDKFPQYYFEVQAGILRRFSYAPMQQNRYVTHVVGHNGYDRANLKNDLALMKLSAPINYNRYVRPICLPTEITAGQSYLQGPASGTICTAVGWGATVEHGIDPDNLREVEVPVLSRCKHKEDEEGKDICAGFVEGGKDACQGDSGGPFMCRNPNIPNQWYLAGIVSHGEGCARPNEPGVYTRVSVYRNWIYENARNDILPRRRPLDKCPGYVCKATHKCIPTKRRCDKIVDCLLGDDEIHCHKNNIARLFKHAMRHMILVGSTQNSTETDQTQSYVLETTTEITSTGTASSTLISDVEATRRVTSTDDSIFGTTFKMESMSVTNSLNRNGSDFTKDGDSSFATSPLISDQPEFITNTETTVTIIDVSPFNSAEKTDYTTTESNAISDEKYFLCKKMLEVIPLSKKCNKVVDCQDATDEGNCTCLDYLRTFYPGAVCDGITDCSDFTDEKDCGSCEMNEFRCKMSNTCISADKKCDSVPNCPFNEDEWDCFALTDGYALLLDEDLRPHLNTEGILSFFYKGTWRPMCGNWTNSKSTSASSACLELGFSDYTKYVELSIKNRSLQVKIQANNSTNFISQLDTDSETTCNALFVKCSNVTITAHEIGNKDKYNVANELYTAPWNAAIYADGEYKCTGALLNLNWVLTSINCFPGILELREHYVAVLFGSRKGYPEVKGPHEQIKLVVQSLAILYSDAVLLRLENSIVFNRYVRPVHFIKKSNAVRSKEICMATGKTTQGTFEVVFLKPVANCAAGSRCFKRISPFTNEKCKSSLIPWSGCIVCDSGNGFYPAAVFSKIYGSCGFSHTAAFTSISLLKTNIFWMMGETAFTVEPQECKGFRCALGQCIESERICDGIPDCRDGVDEAYCDERRETCHLTDTCVCLKSEMKCLNGRCIPKSAFCDMIDDCGDDSDEPDECNCAAYLRLTNPNKICDGVRNCYDRSDENPDICKCEEGKFKCGNGHCISIDMVCDGTADCPKKEDEEQCLSLRSTGDNLHSGEVMTRTAGVWHSGCFSKNLSTFDLEDVCRELGFTASSATLYGNITDTAGHPVLDPFNVVKIHDKFGGRLKIAMRSGNEPFITFKKDGSCYRLFIRCL